MLTQNKENKKTQHLLFYQVENLKDEFETLEEENYILNHNYREKNRNLDFLIRDFKKLVDDVKILNSHLKIQQSKLKGQPIDVDEVNDFILQKTKNEIITIEDIENNFQTLSSEIKTDFQFLIESYCKCIGKDENFKNFNFKKTFKLEINDELMKIINLVNSLNGNDLKSKITNSIFYKNQLKKHLIKLSKELVETKIYTKELNCKLQIDINNLDKISLKKIDESVNHLKNDNEEEKISNKVLLEYKIALMKLNEKLFLLKRNQNYFEKEIFKYINEEKLIETRIDLLKNEKRKLNREIRDACNRIEELTTETNHNQKIFEKLKKNNT